MYLDVHVWVDKIKWIKGYDSNGTLKWGVWEYSPQIYILSLHTLGLSLHINFVQ